MNQVETDATAGGRPRARIFALAGVTASALLLAVPSADAGLLRRPSPKGQSAHQAAKDGAQPIKGPLMIAISIGSQRLTVFDNGVPIAQSPVSTGMAGYPTPMGVFSVIQKNRFHRSNIYSGAPMPFMQRITWSGVALHAGVLPGYPASHGCIRLPHDFAARLWGMTRIGARVVITRHEITPFAFEHSRLSVLTTRTGEGLPRSGELRPTIEEDTTTLRVKTADASAATATSVTDAGGSADASPGGEPKAAPEHKPAPDASSAAPAAAPPAVPAESADTTTAAAEPPQPDRVATPTPHAGEPASAGQAEASIVPAAPAALATPEAAAPAATEAAPETAATIKPPTVAPALPSPVETAAVEPPLADAAALPIDDVFVPPSRPARPLRSGPVSVFVSRREGKLFVRKGFDPLFAIPVTISRPEQPIGTHLFTAAEVKDDGASLRWIAVTMPPEPPKQPELRDRGRDRAGRGTTRPPATPAVALPPSTAAEAMDRIELTPEAVERLSALMSVGASFIISDQGLGYETGLETDFIVLTPEQAAPRVTRRRPAPAAPQQPAFAPARGYVPYYWFR